MPVNSEKNSKAIEDVKKALSDTAHFLIKTADEMQKLGKSLIKAEKDFTKIKISDMEAISTPPSMERIDKVEKIDKKVGPPKRIESEKTHPPIAPKRIKAEKTEVQRIEKPEVRKNLATVRDRISTLLDRLKDEVNIGTDLAAEQMVPKEKENLDTLKSEMTQLYNRFKSIVKEDEFYDLTPEQRSKALKDMAEAIEFLTDEYNK